MNLAHQDKLRVLLVEDSLPIRQRIRSLIEESVAVTIIGEAGTAATALALFREHLPDALVLDLHLAKETAFGVIEEIKKTRPGCVVIVLTNFPIPEYRERCLRLGAEYFFDKSKDFELVPQVLAACGKPGGSPEQTLV